MPKEKPKKSEFTWCADRGKLRKRIKLGDKWHDVYGDTDKEVKAKVKALESAYEEGLSYQGNPTVAQFILKWFPIVTVGKSHSHVTTLRSIINNHIAPNLGSFRLRDVKPMHVQGMLAERQYLSHSHLSKILIYTRQIFNSAIDNNFVLRNPCDRIIAAGKPPEKRGILSIDHVEQLLNAVADTRAYPFCALAVYTGMRREEILGLMLDCVHLNEHAPYIEVKRALHFEGNKGVVNSTLKSEAAYRKIPIPNLLYSILLDIVMSSNSSFVVPSADDQHMSLMAYKRLWEQVTRRVPFYVTPHMLRHTYITTLCDSGMDIKKIQYLAGHSSVDLTLEIYAHAVNNRPEELSSEISNIFAGGNPGGNNEGKTA
jgi:integrase